MEFAHDEFAVVPASIAPCLRATAGHLSVDEIAFVGRRRTGARATNLELPPALVVSNASNVHLMGGLYRVSCCSASRPRT